MNKWDARFANLTKLVSLWSKDPSTKVGAAIIRPDKTVCSVGFNGFPRGVPDDPAWYEDRSIKYKVIKHAEENAIFFANEKLEGYTLYVYPLFTCSLCAGDVIQNGIKRVVAILSPEKMERFEQDKHSFGFDLAMEMYTQAGVEFEIIVDDGNIFEKANDGSE
jgi:dCMP deaminase